MSVSDPKRTLVRSPACFYMLAETRYPGGTTMGISKGTQAIITYFMAVKGTGNKNAIDERRTITINDNAVEVAGFYTFTRMVDGKAVPAPSRFTMLVTKRGSEWCIAHHHSSPHVLPKN